MRQNILCIACVYSVLCCNSIITGQNFIHQSIPFEKYRKNETKKEKFPVVVKALTTNKHKLLQVCNAHGFKNDYSSLSTALSSLSEDSLYEISKIESILFRGIIEMGKDISESIFIEDTTILCLFIEILDSENTAMSINTARQIAMNFSPSLIMGKSNELKERLFPLYIETKYEAYLHLLCMTELTTQERDNILTDTTVGELYKAKLGNKKSEQRIIHSFTQSKIYAQKADYAFRLGYIGSTQCARALLEGMNSDVVSPDKLKSLRYPIIASLARIHPDNNLFHILKQLKDGETSYCRMKSRELTREERKRLKYLLATNKTDKIRKQFAVNYKPVLNHLNNIIEWGEKEYGVIIEKKFSRPYIYDRK